jgi:hypothetical protein
MAASTKKPTNFLFIYKKNNKQAFCGYFTQTKKTTSFLFFYHTQQNKKEMVFVF